MDKFCFALPSGYGWDINQFVKQVKTKAWTKKYESKLSKWADKLTNAGADNVQIIGGMLQSAYGVNIGLQIESKLTEKDFEKIKQNILAVVYK